MILESEIQAELIKVRSAIHQGGSKLSEQIMSELMAIQQALSWVLDKRCCASPYDMVFKHVVYKELNDLSYPQREQSRK